MKRISEGGNVRGISLKLQEEERERRENFVPDVSVLENMTAQIKVDPETKELLQSMGLGNLAGVEVGNPDHHHRGGRYGNPSHLA